MNIRAECQIWPFFITHSTGGLRVQLRPFFLLEALYALVDQEAGRQILRHQGHGR
jgi:hypothetical protein